MASREQRRHQVLPDKTAAARNENLCHSVESTHARLWTGVRRSAWARLFGRFLQDGSGRNPSATKNLAKMYISLTPFTSGCQAAFVGRLRSKTSARRLTCVIAKYIGRVSPSADGPSRGRQPRVFTSRHPLCVKRPIHQRVPNLRRL
jgi:hypothetical protein